MSISSMTLNLPKDTDSDAEEIRTGVKQLYVVRDIMLGHSEDSDASLQNAASEFIGSLNWDIRAASKSDLDSWQKVSELLTGAGLALGFFADAVEEYKETREDLESRWEQYKTDAQNRVDEDDGGLNVNGLSQEDSEIQHLITIKAQLRTEHDTALEIFDEAVEETEKTLTNGPDQGLWERALAEGLLTGREVHVLGGEVGSDVVFSPEEDWNAEEVAYWWHELAPNQQDMAMEEFSEDLRNLDGIPVVVRDELNRDYLEVQIENLSTPGTPPNPYILAQIQEIKDSIDGDDKFLIFFDPFATGGGKAAISNGNPDLADNVSTMVPGMLNSMGTMGTPLERSDALHEQMTMKDPNSNHASIVWMGYNAPLLGEYDPENAAKDLVAFQEGLRATHQGDSPSHNTVIGHSWGGYVAGAADNPEIGGGLGVDSLVLIGAPTSSVDHVSELSTDPEDVHVIQGDDDWIEAFRNGTDFENAPGLLDHQGLALHKDEFYADPDAPGGELGNRLDPKEETGHSDYFEDEETLDYLGDVLTGGRP